MKWIEETANRIRRLEIQGATNVAISAVEALTRELLEAKTQEESSRALGKGVSTLVASRDTEPMLRNGLKFLQSHVASEWTDKALFDASVEKSSSEILGLFSDSKQRIVDIGAQRILDGYTILTHCHSSTVTETLVRAHNQGKRIKVIQTETRPKNQGRITARELVEAGIDTTMIVDSATRHFVKESDVVLVGSDAITSEGNVLNKIGTSQAALVAYESRTPFYVLSSLLKFDPVTVYGNYVAIEERGAQEIWENPPEGLKIRNPAFDVTRRDYISGIITEEGVISPHSVVEAVHRRYGWIFN
jgi:ribose 1,5-bisphosphate isomerase